MRYKLFVIPVFILLLISLSSLVLRTFAAQLDQSIAGNTNGQGILTFATFSRDHKFLQIFSLDLSNRHLEPLTDLHSSNYAPRWSPDGTKIAFTSERDGNAQIYVMGADGANPTRITQDSATDRLPVWSPDGKQIAFESYRDQTTGIYVIPTTGEQQPRILISDALQPAWSPNGDEISFVSFRDNNPEIYVESRGGSSAQITRITFNSGFDNSDEDWNPSWSLDGQYISFESFRTYLWQIYSFDVDTQETKCMTCSLPEFDGARTPVWSPDGTQIAFASSPGICVLSIQTKAIECIGIEDVDNSTLSWKADK